ncbi:MAG: hypothetical protein EBZ77_14015 [Chitinophagia bacterium]|nr:hypothetical protein [Chitinophagia bacterium]
MKLIDDEAQVITPSVNTKLAMPEPVSKKTAEKQSMVLQWSVRFVYRSVSPKKITPLESII